MKILVVDDDLSILESLKLALEMENYQVLAVSQGEKAFKLAKSYLPDLIVLDYLLSGINGFQISKQLKSDELTQHIPIIMISAHPSAIKSVSIFKINSFLAKPFELTQLLTEITQLSSFRKV